MAADTALEWIEGGGLSFTVPAAMLDPSVPMSSVLSARTWQEQLSADERASLRRFLPDPTASEEDVRALVAALFGDGDGDGGGDTHVNMHFGNPAERVWREIQARERDPEVMAHRNAIGVVERGAHELEVRLHHARVARAGMGMLRKFRDADADAAGGGDGGGVTREDRLRAWHRREATPEPDRSHRVGGSDDDDATANVQRRNRDGPRRGRRVGGSREARDARRDGGCRRRVEARGDVGRAGRHGRSPSRGDGHGGGGGGGGGGEKREDALDRGRGRSWREHSCARRASFVDREGGRQGERGEEAEGGQPAQHEGRRAHRAQQKI